MISLPFPFEWAATAIFVMALIHTFSVSSIARIANSFPHGSFFENLFHLLAEIEVVFGVWAAVLLGLGIFEFGFDDMTHQVESLSFTEPIFVFVIMALCSTKPILDLAETFIFRVAKFLPFQRSIAVLFVLLGIAPLMGSLITEPAAMTVIALLLRDLYMQYEIPQKLKYLILGALFVHVSIGGTLTHFAAPPVLMVSEPWNWNTPHMFIHFGWKSLLACIIGTGLLMFWARKMIATIQLPSLSELQSDKSPLWVQIVHMMFLAAIILTSHHPFFFVAIFLFFLGFMQASKEYQTPLNLVPGLLVGFFLGGLVILGSYQGWWLRPLLENLSNDTIFVGTTFLTAVTDNAALAYLGTQVNGLADTTKYYLLAGCVVGGGLTVIANAPNPAGYGILNSSFGDEGIRPVGLALAALPFTFLAACFFYLL